MSLCDAIAYVSHDVDDAVRAGVIDESELPTAAIEILGPTTSQRINTMVTGIVHGSRDGVIDIEPQVKEAMNALRSYLYSTVYPGEVISREIDKAKKILRELYTFFLDHRDDPRLPSRRESDDHERCVVDFLAGMTDRFALNLYERIFLPDRRTL